jgi:hypothetical protein
MQSWVHKAHLLIHYAIQKERLGVPKEDEDDLSRESGVSELEHWQKGALIGQWVNISFHEKKVFIGTLLFFLSIISSSHSFLLFSPFPHITA